MPMNLLHVFVFFTAYSMKVINMLYRTGINFILLSCRAENCTFTVFVFSVAVRCQLVELMSDFCGFIMTYQTSGINAHSASYPRFQFGNISVSGMYVCPVFLERHYILSNPFALNV